MLLHFVLLRLVEANVKMMWSGVTCLIITVHSQCPIPIHIICAYYW